MIFELIAAICIQNVCQDRLIPSAAIQTKTQCEAQIGRADTWAEARQGATLQAAKCVPLLDLRDRASPVTEITQGAFVHVGKIKDPSPENSGDTSNHGFIVGATSVAVIDAGYSRALAEALYISIRLHTDKPISHLLLTHMHPDHTLGGDVFQEAGATAIAAVKFNKAYSGRVDGYLNSQATLIGLEAAHGTYGQLSVTETDGMQINLGDRPLTLQTFPTAHTTNDMIIMDPTSQTTWVGDLVFINHTPALDGSVRGWIAQLEELKHDVGQYVIPGHGPAKAKVPQAFEPTLNYLKALASQMRTAIANGESLQAVLKDKGADLRGSWRLFDSHHRRNATNAYVELEWE
ncbi:MAG: quinoprotein relay system zinc metallohydrolase 2 [Aliishimia sp.]